MVAIGPREELLEAKGLEDDDQSSKAQSTDSEEQEENAIELFGCDSQNGMKRQVPEEGGI